MFSGVMMFDYIGWNEAAELINQAFPAVMDDRTVTYDFARLMDNATTLSTSAFADALIARIQSS